MTKKSLQLSALVITVITCFSSHFANAQSNSTKPTIPSAFEIIQAIAHDSLQGRKPSTVGYDKAARYVEQQLLTIGAKPLFGNSFVDSVSAYYGYNVVGVLESPQSTNEYILIGAHLDHLGVKSYGTDTIYNGANDNASGVAAVLKIAEALSKQQFSKKIIIALFTSEETGLDGSNALAKKIKAQQIPLKYVINFDMIGTTMTSAPNKVFVTGFDKSNLATTANSLLKEDFLLKDAQAEEMDLFRYSDNFSFYRVLNIPAHTMSTFNLSNFDCYHKACDEVSVIDVKNLEAIIEKSTTFIVELLKQNSQIALN